MASIIYRDMLEKMIVKHGKKAFTILPSGSKVKPAWKDQEFTRTLIDIHDKHLGSDTEKLTAMAMENPSLIYFQKKLGYLGS
jgi:hypothetical protein